MSRMYKLALEVSEWTSHDLGSYKIHIEEQDEAQFFNDPPLEHTRIAGMIDYRNPNHEPNAPSLPSAIQPSLSGFAEHEGRIQGLDAPSLALFKRLDLAMDPSEDDGSATTDFATDILRAMGYENDQTIVRTQKILRLCMGDHIKRATADACLTDLSSNVLLLVQGDGSHKNVLDPEARLVATAIAAFQENNTKRVDELFLEPLETQLILGIMMTRTFPMFYKIQVSAHLGRSVMADQHPYSHTTVYRHTPRVPGRRSDGMRPLDNRKSILRCLEKFKKFVY